MEPRERGDELCRNVRLGDVGEIGTDKADDHHDKRRIFHPIWHRMHRMDQVLIVEDRPCPERSIIEEARCEHLPREHGANHQHPKWNEHRQRAFVRVIPTRRILTGLCWRFVDTVLDMLAFDPARLAPERQEHQPPAVKAGEQRGGHAQPERHGRNLSATRKRHFKHSVFRPEPSKADAKMIDAQSSDRERPDQHRPERERDLFPQTAIIPHILLVMHRMDHRTSAKEQQRLEESVREQVEHRHAVCADASGKEHVAELRAGRIGDHPLDVPLRRADCRGKEAGRGSDDRHNRKRSRRGLEHWRKPTDHEHARRHHRRCVDQRADRSRTFHRVWQPGVQEQLRRFAHRADEQQDAQYIHGVQAHAEEPDARARHGRRGFKDFGDRSGLEHQIGAENPEHEAQVADAVDHESLDRGSACARFLEPEANQ